VRFEAEFVRFRDGDNWPVAVVAVPVVAATPDEAMTKLRCLFEAGRWPELADAVQLFEDREEIDSFIARLPRTSEIEAPD
jgi:hypothetical protein